MEQEINPPELPHVPAPISPKSNKIPKIISIGLIVLFILGFGLHALLNRYSESSSMLSSLLVHPVDSNRVISNTHSISGVSENPDELLKILGLKHKSISGDNQPDKGITKTEDNRFWFFTVGPDDCVEFCSFQNYMIDTQKKTVSDLDVNDVMYNINPIGGSIVTIKDNVSYDNAISVDKVMIYDALKNEVIDEINPSNGTGNYKLLSENLYIYSNNGVLYSRNIQKHSSTKIGRFYVYNYGYDNTMSENPLNIVFSDSGETFYALIYDSEALINPVNEVPTKDDLVRIVEWNIKNETKKYISEQRFNFPLTFQFIDKDTILLGGGMDFNGVKTFSTYLVNVLTGVTKEIFKGDTLAVDLDKDKKQIDIYEPGLNDFISGTYGGPHDAGSINVFDYNGNFISKTYFKGQFSYKEIKEGKGSFAKVEDTVKVKYSIPNFSTDLQFKIESSTNVSTLEFSSLGMKIGEKRHILFSKELMAKSNLRHTLPNHISSEFDLELMSINGKSTPSKDIIVKNTNNDVSTIYPAPPKKTVEKLITTKLGDTIKVDGSDLIITDVEADNRCVMYADTCAAPNNFDLKVILPWITSDNKKAKFDYIFNIGANNHGIGNSSVVLKEVKPERQQGKTIKKSDYIFTFSIMHQE